MCVVVIRRGGLGGERGGTVVCVFCVSENWQLRPGHGEVSSREEVMRDKGAKR